MSEIDREHGPEVPEADAQEQLTPAVADDAPAPEIPEPDAEADAADVWEQRHEVPLDEGEDEPPAE